MVLVMEQNHGLWLGITHQDAHFGTLCAHFDQVALVKIWAHGWQSQHCGVCCRKITGILCRLYCLAVLGYFVSEYPCYLLHLRRYNLDNVTIEGAVDAGE